MQIDPKSSLAGYPAMRIRDLLRRHETHLTVAAVSRFMGISQPEAHKLIEAMLREGWVEETDAAPNLSWQCTDSGVRLALARAGRPIKRTTAERLVQQVLERANAINADDGYAYTINRLAVFGSFLTNSETVGDVDIAIQLKRRVEDDAIFKKLLAQRVDQARERGWNPRTKFELGAYPQLELVRRLKGTISWVSLHEFDDLEKLGCDFKILLDVGAKR